MKAYSLANKHLTILPWPPVPEEYGPKEARAALVRFPLVGLALGLILVAGDIALTPLFPASVRNGLAVLALIVLSAGRPLGALSQWMDSLRKKEEGGIGAAVVAVVCLLKFAALLALPGPGRWSALILAPVLGRASVAYLIVQLPGTGRRNGEEDALPDDPSPDEGYATIGWTLAVSLVFGFFGGLFVALIAGLGAMALKRVIQRLESERDVHSAAGEIVETGAFLLCSAWWGA